MLVKGDIAPNFSLEGDDGQLHQLKGFLGKNVVIFFYPKDLTPGCTTEACEFNQALASFKKQETEVLGISKDSLASHARFKSKYSLEILLLSDPQFCVHKQYGAFGEKKMYGKVISSGIRTTYLIDRTGMVVRVWQKVRVKNHVNAVLETLEKC